MGESGFYRRSGYLRPRPARLVATCIIAIAFAGAPDAGADAPPRDLTELSLEELMNTEVTSVSRKPESRAEAADAIYVITGEEIIRSGVRTLADALRLAPGVHVARVDASGWAVGVRGFGSRLSRSVLVLVDGRSVYNPLFAGTYWELQGYPLEDVDRIEIIRGPGGTLWGANAFNGVINIITKAARATQGGYLDAGAGNEERGFGAIRYGGRIGEGGYYRGYAQGFNRDAGHNPAGPDYDAWRLGRSGFRSDWSLGTADALTVQGDVFAGSVGERIPITTFQTPFRRVVREDGDVSGANLLGRWTRALGPHSDLAFRAYYDNFQRDDPHFTERRNTLDFDLQHRFPLFWRQEVIWGATYRVTKDHTEGIRTFAHFVPAHRTLNLISGFVQDEITLVPDRLRVTFGSKFEHNDLSGFEVQPSGRILWTPDAGHTVWASAGRAVRTPSRIEEDYRAANRIALEPAPVLLRLRGDRDFESETVVNYQVGYRVRPMPRLFLDVVGFYNEFDDLLSAEAGTARPGRNVPAFVVPVVLANGLHGESAGAEIAADASLTDWWRLNAAYSYLNISLQHDPDSPDAASSEVQEDTAPQNMVTLRSLMNLPSRMQLDVTVRYVDSLPAPRISRYVELDVRVARRFGRSVEVSVVGQNLLHDHHREFAGGTEVERGYYGMVRWWW